MTGHLQTSPMVVTAIRRRQLWGQSPLSLEFNVTGFDRFEFKFRPKRSDFGRKKLRTAETAVGFRLSEVVLSLGRRGGKLGRLPVLTAQLANKFIPIQGQNRSEFSLPPPRCLDAVLAPQRQEHASRPSSGLDG